MAFQRNDSRIPASLAVAFFAAGGFFAAPNLRAQDKSPARPETDVLIFINGEKLIGKLERSTGSSLLFKSNMAGEVKVDWSKVKELHTDRKFAVIPKGVRLYRKQGADDIPQGTLSVSDQKIEVHPQTGRAPRAVPVKDTEYVVDETTFQKAILRTPNFFEQWKGAVTAGASLVAATQNSRTFTGAITMSQSVPAESWLDIRNRTTINANASYGDVTQPDTPKLKTEIFHADVERDQYLTGSRMFAFVQAGFDHNISQGLDLQQAYGSGIGWTAIHTPIEILDLKVSMNYVNQQFRKAEAPPPAPQEPNQKLIGSSFAETFNRHFWHGIVFSQLLTVTPAWNNVNAFSGNAGANLAMPVFERLSVSLGTADTFLNDPPEGFKKNSFQFTAGITYTLP